MKTITKTLLIALLLCLQSNIFAQQIGTGYASMLNDFTPPLLTGVYNSINPIGGVPDNSNPWQHLIVARHANTSNNCQLQIGSSFYTNDRLYFRKIITGGLDNQNSVWNEIATRGANSFAGNQIINGNTDITGSLLAGSYNLNFTNKIVGNNDAANYFIGHYSAAGGSGLQLKWFGGIRFSDATGDIMQVTNGNVGIGTSSPQYKLDVYGKSSFNDNMVVKAKIEAKEIKVTFTPTADFVFALDYKLPKLEDVEKYVVTEKHLPEIASAKEMEKDGVNVAEFQIKLLQKIEELTLYTIAQHKQLQMQQEQINCLEKQLRK